MRKIFSTLSFFLFTLSFFSQVLIFGDEESDSFDVDIPSTVLPLACLEGQPSAYVHGCVNVMTGQFLESVTDVVAYHGVNPITIERSFFGSTAHKGNMGAGWFLNHNACVKKSSKSDKKKHGSHLTLEEQGGGLPFWDSEDPESNSHQSLSVPISALEKSVSNTSSGYIGGQTNIKNWRLSEIRENCFTLVLGDGAQKHFNTHSSSRLSWNIKPSGNKIRYIYSHENDSLIQMHLENAEGERHFCINFDEMSEKAIKKTKKRSISTRSGKVSYRFADFGASAPSLVEVEKSDAPPVEYSYWQFPKTEGAFHTICRKMLPEGRYLEANYYFGPGFNSIEGHPVNITRCDDDRVYRVKELLAPAGVDRTPVPIYQFVYDLNYKRKSSGKIKKFLNGACYVYNALKHRTCYAYDSNYRLNSVCKYDANRRAYTVEHLSWGQNGTENATHLMSRVFTEYGKGIVFKKTYDYDSMSRECNP